jgi:hypothetical protein
MLSSTEGVDTGHHCQDECLLHYEIALALGEMPVSVSHAYVKTTSLLLPLLPLPCAHALQGFGNTLVMAVDALATWGARTTWERRSSS